jgi:hypothetical protein
VSEKHLTSYNLKNICDILDQCLGSGSTRIRVFLGLLDPDPLVRDTDQDPDPDPYLFLTNVLNGLK